jgi:hypothetical protein
MTLIEPSSVTQIKAGSNVVLSCVASNSNPNSQIAWYKDGLLVATQPNQSTNTSSKISIDYETTSYFKVSVARD